MRRRRRTRVEGLNEDSLDVYDVLIDGLQVSERETFAVVPLLDSGRRETSCKFGIGE